MPWGTIAVSRVAVATLVVVEGVAEARRGPVAAVLADWVASYLDPMPEAAAECLEIIHPASLAVRWADV